MKRKILIPAILAGLALPAGTGIAQASSSAPAPTPDNTASTAANIAACRL